MGKDTKIDPSEVIKERRKLLKILLLLAKVYKKSAKNGAQKKACESVATDLKRLRR